MAFYNMLKGWQLFMNVYVLAENIWKNLFQELKTYWIY